MSTSYGHIESVSMNDRESAEVSLVAMREVLESLEEGDVERFVRKASPRLVTWTLDARRLDDAWGLASPLTAGQWIEFDRRLGRDIDWTTEDATAPDLLWTVVVAINLSAHYAGLVEKWMDTLSAWRPSGLPTACPRALELTCFDGGSGDSTLVRLPDGKTLLVDCKAGAAERLDGYGVSSEQPLYALVISHPHWDHVEDVGPIVFRGLARQVVVAPNLGHEGASVWVLAVALLCGVPFVRARRHRGTSLGGCALHIDYLVGPWLEPNERSLVMALDMGDTIALLPGDAEGAAAYSVRNVRDALAARLPYKKLLLKMSHHGSNGPDHAVMLGLGDQAFSAITPFKSGSPLPRKPAVCAAGQKGAICRTDCGHDVRLGSLEHGPGWVFAIPRRGSRSCASPALRWCMDSGAAPLMSRCQAGLADGPCPVDDWLEGRC